MTIEGDKICLRTLVPDDLEFVFRWENDPEVWKFGGEARRFSRKELRQFIENQQFGFQANGQLRFIAEHAGRPVGMIDLFDHNPVENSARVGILICDPADRRCGYGREALELLMDFAAGKLGLRRLFCSVDNENIPSFELFRAAGFLPEREFLVRNF